MEQEAESGHQPVLLEEVIEQLAPQPAGCYVDGTTGAGGHAKAILETEASISLLGIDRDQEAVASARQRLSGYGSRVHLVCGNYTAMLAYAAELGWASVAGILLDLGASALQINQPERGFSYLADGPLDMRMSSGDPVTAAMLLNQSSETELTRIFREYGEEPRARQLAWEIVRRRAAHAWERTGELAELIRKVAGGQGRQRQRALPRCFQALRIAVNDELGCLEQGLDAALKLLAPGGRLVVISFHSLEDRLVKRRLRYEASDCICPPGLPICRCGKVVTLKILTKKPITPGPAELARNKRASAAKLRAAEKIFPG